MRRAVCPNHAVLLKPSRKAAILSEPDCVLCKWEKRPLKLQDMARALEGIAGAMRIAAADETYDPFGVTYLGPLQEILNSFYHTMHPAYQKGFIESITKERK